MKTRSEDARADEDSSDPSANVTGMRIRQSDLKSWQRCPLSWRYRHIDGLPDTQGAAAVYGTVIHACVEFMEINNDFEGALRLFEDMWTDPQKHLGDRGRIDHWEYGRSREKGFKEGPKALHDWWSLFQWDTDIVLGREFQFNVPIGDGHTLHGTVDKLVEHHTATGPVLKVCDFKGLSIDTPLATPDGWTTMGAVAVGDTVYDSHGQPCQVIHKSAVKMLDCYRVRFDDGSSVICDDEHIWWAYDQIERDQAKRRRREPQARPVSIAEIRGSLVRSGQKNWAVPVAQSLNGQQKSLPIDPYLFGCWLGDGHRKDGAITKTPSLFTVLEGDGHELLPERANHSPKVFTRTVKGLRKSLREAGLLGIKQIPDAYMRAHRHQRIRLLQGILDTDGSWNIARHRVALNSTDKNLIHQVADLIRTLGIRTIVHEYAATGFGLQVTAYALEFTPTEEFPPFRLPEKAAKVARYTPTAKSRRRMIVAVDPMPTVPTACIGVDSPNSTYLAGEFLIPTHNTGKKPTYEYLHDDLQFTAYSYATTRPEFWATLPNGEALYERYRDYPRHGEWIQMRGGVQRMDAGPRDESHYRRLIYACNAFAESVALRIFVPQISGETCKWCAYRPHCGLAPVEA